MVEFLLRLEIRRQGLRERLLRQLGALDRSCPTIAAIIFFVNLYIVLPFSIANFPLAPWVSMAEPIAMALATAAFVLLACATIFLLPVSIGFL